MVIGINLDGKKELCKKKGADIYHYLVDPLRLSHEDRDNTEDYKTTTKLIMKLLLFSEKFPFDSFT